MQGFPQSGVPMTASAALPVQGVPFPFAPNRLAGLPQGQVGGKAPVGNFPPPGFPVAGFPGAPPAGSPPAGFAPPPGFPGPGSLPSPGPFQSPGGFPSPSPFQAPGTYPAAGGFPAPAGPGGPVASPFLPPPSQTPGAPAGGPATLGTHSSGSSTGGVAGVSMLPISGVAAPATTGGPHALPTLPQVPLPQGFPNPFSLQQIPLASQSPQPEPPPQAGTTYTTGPQGFLPGLGFFGTPAQAGQPGVPGGLTVPQEGPGPTASPPTVPLPPGGLPQAGKAGGGAPPFPMPPLGFMGPQGPSPAPTGFSGGLPPAPAPQAQPQVTAAPPQAQPQPQPQPQASAAPVAPVAPPQMSAPGQSTAAPGHPFWVGLAWQLLQSPAVKALLGQRHGPLVFGDDRLRTLGVASACLTGPELQGAFRGLTAGEVKQEKFLQSFAEALHRSLKSAGVL